jgi:hypothetical protein
LQGYRKKNIKKAVCHLQQAMGMRVAWFKSNNKKKWAMCWATDYFDRELMLEWVLRHNLIYL